MFLCVCLVLLPRLLPVLSLNQEGLYLQQSKLGLDDPDAALSAWNPSDDSPCGWPRVTCDAASGSVTAVDLSNANVAGPFPLSLCRLANLSSLSLYNNSINHTLPPGISSCQSLRRLDLAQNFLSGALPESLPDIPNLRYLDLSGNNLSGDIPSSFGRFRQLEVLSLVYNLLDGRFPAFFGNISTLRQLNVSFNPFRPSTIPLELGNLTSLEILWLTECNLEGRIPDSLGRLKNLTDLDLAENNLEGPIPSSLTGLTNVVQIEIYSNSLTGMLPAGMSNLTKLRLFDASMNRLGGTIPDELCQLPLESLNLYQNQFAGSLPASLAKSPNLNELRLFENRLTGELPRDLGKNSPLSHVDVSTNMLTGRIPGSLCANVALEELLMIQNSFSGSIPSSLGHCYTLKRVRLGHNRFSGEVPAGFWGLPRVEVLELSSNSFTGGISSNMSAASALSSLLISENNFTGNIPEEIGRLRNLIDFSGGDNQFTGVLPASIVNLSLLEKLDLHSNKLFDRIPAGMHLLKKLYELNLAHNELSGNIPEEIGSLSALNYLDLSQNRFSGKIPLQLQNLKLNRFNLSHNRLSGYIPPLFATSMYQSSFLGNPSLCRGLGGSCNGPGGAKNKGCVWVLRLIFMLAALVFVVGVSCFYRKYRNFKIARRTEEKLKWTLMSFHKLDFTVYEILDCLDEDNLIGSGVSGKVYKAVLGNGEAVAVKKLCGESKLSDERGEGAAMKNNGFEAEVKTLGKIRHKNIVKLWSCFSSKDCELLVYEYMPNGSLGDLLHSSKGGLLDWPTRYRIAMDAAEGLSYLHHDCVPPIVHRDVKSNNILLDEDFRARVADFGVAKVVDLTGKAPQSMSLVVGSRGYIAPEYAYTVRVNEKSDTYSFGVVLMELVTGRRPIEAEFGEKDLVRWVCATVDQKGVDGVLDSKLDGCHRAGACRVLNIALACTSPLPINRPPMRRVVKMLVEAGEEQRLKMMETMKAGKLSPYYYDDGSDNGSTA